MFITLSAVYQVNTVLTPASSLQGDFKSKKTSVGRKLFTRIYTGN